MLQWDKLYITISFTCFLLLPFCGHLIPSIELQFAMLKYIPPPCIIRYILLSIWSCGCLVFTHSNLIATSSPLEISVPRMKIVFMYAGLMLPRDSDEEIALWKLTSFSCLSKVKSSSIFEMSTWFFQKGDCF